MTLTFRLPGPRSGVLTHLVDCPNLLIPRAALEAAISDARMRIERRALYGAINHPQNRELWDRAARVVGCHLADSGESFFDFQPLPTQRGRALLALVGAQTRMGISPVIEVKYSLPFLDDATRRSPRLVRSLTFNYLDLIEDPAFSATYAIPLILNSANEDCYDFPDRLPTYLEQLELTRKALAAAMDPDGALFREWANTRYQLQQFEAEQERVRTLQTEIANQLAAIEHADGRNLPPERSIPDEYTTDSERIAASASAGTRGPQPVVGGAVES